MTTTTCERQVCALTDTNERVMRPCIREAGHEGVCRYTVPGLPACPSWCRLHAGHDWDSIEDDGTESRGHRGPDFGLVSVGSVESSARPGVHRLESLIGTTVDLTPEQWRDVAGDCSLAAEWLEANR